MTIAEKIEVLEKELAELKEKLDILKEYREFPDGVSYSVTNLNGIRTSFAYGVPSAKLYCHYHTQEYAEMAMEMKEFNDKLLAFKWCYDRDYVPDWDDEGETKYSVMYDNQSESYKTAEWRISKFNTVCFSKKRNRS